VAMRMEYSLQMRPELRMKLAPQIIQSIEILQLPMLELQQRIKQELVENPVLEMEEPVADLTQEEPTTRDDRNKDGQDYEKVDSFEEVWEDYGSQTYRKTHSAGEKDKKLEAMQNTAARPASLQDYLASQLTLMDLPDELRRAAENIVYNIDENGYLRFDLDAVGNSMDPPPADSNTLEAALRIVQDLDPPGIGARDLKECLLLQLRDEQGDYTLERKLIENHLEDLSMNRYPKITKRTGCSMDALKQAKDFISRLNPKPGAVFGGERPQYITPDVTVECVDGKYEIRLEDGYMPKLFVSPSYKRIMRDAKESQARDYIRKKLSSARWLIDAIAQRRNTLYKISHEIVEFQRDFLDKGINFLHPLKMQTVADRTGVHVSTVSRAIADKYMQTPRGIFDMKFFFTGGMRNAQGTLTSRKSVKQRVLDVIASEDKHHPFSDDEITKKLQSQGFDIQRRTVTKYRKAMNILSSRQRRQY